MSFIPIDSKIQHILLKDPKLYEALKSLSTGILKVESSITSISTTTTTTTSGSLLGITSYE
jgi:hypothetical protein